MLIRTNLLLQDEARVGVKTALNDLVNVVADIQRLRSRGSRLDKDNKVAIQTLIVEVVKNVNKITKLTK